MAKIAHIPEALARQQLSTVPHEFWLHDRAGNPVVHYGGDDVHFDPGSSGVQILDPDTLEHQARTGDRSGAADQNGRNAAAVCRAIDGRGVQ